MHAYEQNTALVLAISTCFKSFLRSNFALFSPKWDTLKFKDKWLIAQPVAKLQRAQFFGRGSNSPELGT